MNLPKEFEYYLQRGIAKKSGSDKPRAKFLISESETSLEGLNERIKIIGINNKNANSIIKDCYDIIMELVRAKLLIDGYSSSGNYAHEGEISYLKKLGFIDNDLSFLNDLRYFRNSVTYYGKILNEEYAKKVYDFLNKVIGQLKEAVSEHKTNFFSFIDKIKHDEKVGIIAHANCIDGMASTVFMVEILKKKYPSVKVDINFISYTAGSLDKLAERFKKIEIKSVFVLDLNVDVSLFEEFENFRKNFDVLLVDHHPLNPNLRIDEKIIKTHSADCTSFVVYKFGEDFIDYKKWNWLVCVASVSEFSWKNPENLKFIQSYYPAYTPGDEDSDLLKIVDKIGSLVIYYSKDSLKAYDLILKRNFDKIDEIHNEVSVELERCLKDFDKNAESHFNKHLYFYFFKSRFSLGSKMSTILSVGHKGSTIIVFSEVEGTDMIKAGIRNNGEPLKYTMTDLVRAGITGLENAMGGGHAPASGGSFLRKDLDKFKEQVKSFVKGKIEN